MSFLATASVARAEVRHQRPARSRARSSIRRPTMPNITRNFKKGVPFLGDALLKDILFSALAVIVVVAIAAWLGPKGPTGPPDPDACRMRIRVPNGHSCGCLPCSRSARRRPRRSSCWFSRSC